MMKGRKEEALGVFERILAVQPSNAHANHNLLYVSALAHACARAAGMATTRGWG